MRIFPLAFAALALTVGQTHAQSCRTLRYQASEIHVESLELFDTDGKPMGRLEKKALPEQFDVSDCEDKVYVMLHLQQHDFLVKKTDLATNVLNRGCLNISQRQLLGVPGAADVTTCEKQQK